ncbi:MAG: hypothetical protein ACTSX4_08735 [Candidatus Helarchaeota archaeon]
MPRILEMNLGDRELRKKQKMLLTGTCLPTQYPDIFKKYMEEDRRHVHICLETFLADQVGYKLAMMIKYSKVKDVLVLTIDGSPHCLHLHILMDDLKKHFLPDLKLQHVVIEKGKIHEIDNKNIKISRHLHKIQNLVDKLDELQ